MTQETPMTYNALLAQLASFLTISIHQIICVRHCYPRESFHTARAYNYPVAQSRHPKVCEWINSAVRAVITEVSKGAVARIAVVIAHPETYQPLERFLLDLGRFPVVPKGDAEYPLTRDADLQQLGEEEHVDLSEQLRATLAALSNCNPHLRPIPDKCTFTVAIELKDDIEAVTPIGHPQPWVPVQPSLQKRKRGSVEMFEDAGRHQPSNGDEEAKKRSTGFQGDNAGIPTGHSQPSAAKNAHGPSNADEAATRQSIDHQRDLGGVRTLPIRTVEAGEMNFEMWVEEGRAKGIATTQESASSASRMES